MVPYELIGRIVVYGVATVGAIIGVGVVALLLVAGWQRFWWKVVNVAWGDYDPKENPPPEPRRTVAVVAWGLGNFKRPSKIHEKLKEAHSWDD